MIDRSKFKATSIKELEKQDKQVNNLVGIYSNNYGDIVPIHDIDDGLNYFRLYPAHPGNDGALSIETEVVNYLPYNAPMRDENKNIVEGKFERRNKRIFNAKIHGGANIDLVEEYIKFVEKLAAENFSKDEEKISYLAPVHGNRFKGGKFGGIMPQKSFIAYADKYVNGKPVFGRLKFGTAVKMGISFAASMEKSSDPLGTTDGCFTNVEKARLCIINYNKNLSARDRYKVALDTDIDDDGRVKFYPLTDEQLEHFMTVEPLISYRKLFRKRDFELQLAGLQMFDEEHGYGVFEYDEFLDIVEKISDIWAETEDGEKEQNNVEEEKEQKNKENVIEKKAKELVKEEVKEENEQSSSTEDRIARIRSMRERMKK